MSSSLRSKIRKFRNIQFLSEAQDIRCRCSTAMDQNDCRLRGIRRLSTHQHGLIMMGILHVHAVPAKNSIRIEIIDVSSLLLLCLPLPMFRLFLSFLGTLRSFFQTRSALQLENLTLRHQINVPRRSQRGRVRLAELDRLL